MMPDDDVRGDVSDLWDALDAARLDARNYQRERDAAHREVADRTAERDDARVKLDEIWALCDEREDAFRRAAGDWEHTEEYVALNGGLVSTQHIRAILDRKTNQPWGNLE